MLDTSDFRKPAHRCPTCGGVRVVHPVTREIRAAFNDQLIWDTRSIRNRIMTILPACAPKQISNGLDWLKRQGEIENIGYGKYRRAAP